MTMSESFLLLFVMSFRCWTCLETQSTTVMFRSCCSSDCQSSRLSVLHSSLFRASLRRRFLRYRIDRWHRLEVAIKKLTTSKQERSMSVDGWNPLCFVSPLRALSIVPRLSSSSPSKSNQRLSDGIAFRILTKIKDNLFYKFE